MNDVVLSVSDLKVAYGGIKASRTLQALNSAVGTHWMAAAPTPTPTTPALAR